MSVLLQGKNKNYFLRIVACEIWIHGSSFICYSQRSLCSQLFVGFSAVPFVVNNVCGPYFV